MGAGKSTLGRGARRPARTRRSSIRRRRHRGRASATPIADVFATRGEGAFRELEEEAALECCRGVQPAVIALGGGALVPRDTRALARARSHVHLEVDGRRGVEARRGERPSARARPGGRVPRALSSSARRCTTRRGRARPRRRRHRPRRRRRPRRGGSTLGELVPGDAVVADERVRGLDRRRTGIRARGARSVEQAKTLADAERLWQALRLDRAGALVAVGGGTTTDLGRVRRGDLHARRLLGRRADDARRPGRRSDRRQDRRSTSPQGKNLVGAFHWPVATVIDTRCSRRFPRRSAATASPRS